MKIRNLNPAYFQKRKHMNNHDDNECIEPIDYCGIGLPRGEAYELPPTDYKVVGESLLHFNGLDPAEAERLAILAEECGEVMQIIGKILRHGYNSHSPNDPYQVNNRNKLMMELGDIMAIETMMTNAGDISQEIIGQNAREKLRRIGRFLHHNRIE